MSESIVAGNLVLDLTVDPSSIQAQISRAAQNIPPVRVSVDVQGNSAEIARRVKTDLGGVQAEATAMQQRLNGLFQGLGNDAAGSARKSAAAIKEAFRDQAAAERQAAQEQAQRLRDHRATMQLNLRLTAEAARAERERSQANINALDNEMRAHRNMWQARQLSDDQVIEVQRRIQAQAILQAAAVDKTSDAYRRLTQVAAGAQRTIDQAQRINTPGGFAFGITQGITQALGNLGPFGQLLEQMVNAGMQAAQEAAREGAQDVGRQAGAGLSRGLNGQRDEVKRAATNLASEVQEGAEDRLDIRSPSRVMHRVGAFAGEGLADGLLSKKAEVAAAAKQLANTAEQNAAPHLNAISGGGMGGVAVVPGLQSAQAGFGKVAVQAALATAAVGGTALALGAVGVGFVNGTKKAAEFQHGLAEMSLLTDKLPSQMGATGQAILKMTTDVNRSFGELKAGYEEILGASVRGTGDEASVLRFLRTSANLAKVARTETKTAADALTSILNAYEMDASQAAQVSDMLWASIKAGKVSLDQAASSLGATAGQAKSLNVPLDELLSAMALLTTRGIPASTALEYIRSALSNVQKPSKEAAGTAKDLGIQFSATALKSMGLVKFLDQLGRGVGDNSEALATLIGDVGGLQAVLGLLNGGLDDTNGILKQVRESTGAVDRDVIKLKGTAVENAKAFSVAWDRAQISFTAGVLPMFTTALNWGTDFLNKLVEINAEFKKMGEGKAAYGAPTYDLASWLERTGLREGDLTPDELKRVKDLLAQAQAQANRGAQNSAMWRNMDGSPLANPFNLPVSRIADLNDRNVAQAIGRLGVELGAIQAAASQRPRPFGPQQGGKANTNLPAESGEFGYAFISSLVGTFKNDPKVSSDCAVIAHSILSELGIQLEKSPIAKTLMENALKAGFQRVDASSRENFRPGDLLTYQGADYGARMYDPKTGRYLGQRGQPGTKGGEGFHSAVYAGKDSKGNHTVIENPGLSNTRLRVLTEAELNDLIVLRSPQSNFDASGKAKTPFLDAPDKAAPTSRTPKSFDRYVAEAQRLTDAVKLAEKEGNKDHWRVATGALERFRDSGDLAAQALAWIGTQTEKTGKKASEFGQQFDRLKGQLDITSSLDNLGRPAAELTGRLETIRKEALAGASAEKARWGETAKYKALLDLAGDAAKKLDTIRSRKPEQTELQRDQAVQRERVAMEALEKSIRGADRARLDAIVKGGVTAQTSLAKWEAARQEIERRDELARNPRQTDLQRDQAAQREAVAQQNLEKSIRGASRARLQDIVAAGVQQKGDLARWQAADAELKRREGLRQKASADERRDREQAAAQQLELDRALREGRVADAERLVSDLKRRMQDELEAAGENLTRRAQIVDQRGPQILAAERRLALRTRDVAVKAAQDWADGETTKANATLKGQALRDRLGVIEEERVRRVGRAYQDAATAIEVSEAAQAGAVRSGTQARGKALDSLQRQYEEVIDSFAAKSLAGTLTDEDVTGFWRTLNDLFRDGAAAGLQLDPVIAGLRDRARELGREAPGVQAAAQALAEAAKGDAARYGNPDQLMQYGLRGSYGVGMEGYLNALKGYGVRSIDELSEFNPDAARAMQVVYQDVLDQMAQDQQDAAERAVAILDNTRAEMEAIADQTAVAADLALGERDSGDRETVRDLGSGGAARLTGYLAGEGNSFFGERFWTELGEGGREAFRGELGRLAPEDFAGLGATALRGLLDGIGNDPDWAELRERVQAGLTLSLEQGSTDAGYADLGKVLEQFGALDSRAAGYTETLRDRLLPELERIRDSAADPALRDMAEKAITSLNGEVDAAQKLADVLQEVKLAQLDRDKGAGRVSERDYLDRREALLTSGENGRYARESEGLTGNAAEAARVQHEERLTAIRADGETQRQALTWRLQDETLRVIRESEAADLDYRHSLGLVSEAGYLAERQRQAEQAARDELARRTRGMLAGSPEYLAAEAALQASLTQITQKGVTDRLALEDRVADAAITRAQGNLTRAQGSGYGGQDARVALAGAIQMRMASLTADLATLDPQSDVAIGKLTRLQELADQLRDVRLGFTIEIAGFDTGINAMSALQTAAGSLGSSLDSEFTKVAQGSQDMGTAVASSVAAMTVSVIAELQKQITATMTAALVTDVLTGNWGKAAVDLAVIAGVGIGGGLLKGALAPGDATIKDPSGKTTGAASSAASSAPAITYRVEVNSTFNITEGIDSPGVRQKLEDMQYQTALRAMDRVGMIRLPAALPAS